VYSNIFLRATASNFLVGIQEKFPNITKYVLVHLQDINLETTKFYFVVVPRKSLVILQTKNLYLSPAKLFVLLQAKFLATHFPNFFFVVLQEIFS
jgi:hypothetical protein